MNNLYSLLLLFLVSFIVIAVFALFDDLIAAKFPPTLDQTLYKGTSCFLPDAA